MRFRPFLTLLAATLCLAIAALTAAVPVYAAADSGAPPTNKGLYISPVRQYISMNAGTAKTAKITVGNYTTHPMVVRFSVKAFSVENYTYNFDFTDPPYKRLGFDTASATLKPNETRAVPYTITLPANSKPGGQYYTLFATGTGETGDARQQIQATSLLYLTVNGKLIKSGGIIGGSIAHFSFKPEILYSLIIKNTGNIHYFVYMNAQAVGLLHLHKQDSATETHLLMPGTTRRFDSSLPISQLPGIYHVTYGYKTDFGQTVSRSGYTLYIPPWFIALLILAAWLIWIIVHRRRQRKPQPAARETTTD